MADKEYIERKAALLAITNDGCSVSNVGALMGVPTANVVEVVRCKDCMYYRPQVKSVQWENKTNYCCRKAVIKVKPNDFCSYGEAKMEGKGDD